MDILSWSLPFFRYFPWHSIRRTPRPIMALADPKTNIKSYFPSRSISHFLWLSNGQSWSLPFFSYKTDTPQPFYIPKVSNINFLLPTSREKVMRILKIMMIAKERVLLSFIRFSKLVAATCSGASVLTRIDRFLLVNISAFSLISLSYSFIRSFNIYLFTCLFIYLLFTHSYVRPSGYYPCRKGMS